MNLFSIKMIAVLTMVADHLGLFLFPDIFLLRVIGRMSFPLFAWAIANGAYHTTDINKYLLRLMLLAIISQIPYQLLFGIYNIPNPGLNVLFTLSLGLLAIVAYKKIVNTYFRILITVVLSTTSFMIGSDYGVFGVLSVVLFYLFYKNKIITVISYLILVTVFYLFPYILNISFGVRIEVSNLNVFQLYSLASLIIIILYNGDQGYKIKHFFYLFYPVHLMLIYLMSNFL